MGDAIRPPFEHELDAFAHCVEAAFLFEFTPSEHDRFLESLEPERCLVAVDPEEGVVGVLASHLVELTVPGPVVVPAAAVTDVGVLPTHRGRGLSSALIDRFLIEARRRAESLALLDAATGGLYGRFGFAPATWSARYRIELDGRVRVGAPSDLPLRLFRPDEARKTFPEVFELARQFDVGEVSRSEAIWEELFVPVEATGSARFFVAHAPSGLVDAYAIYATQQGPAGVRLDLEELVATTDAGYRALWGYLIDRNGARAIETGPRPLDEALELMLSDPRALSVLDRRDRGWLRLVDVAAALGTRLYEVPGRLCFLLEDERCPWNAGILTLTVDDDGQGVLAPSNDRPEISLDASALAATFLGGSDPLQLSRAGRIAALRVGGIEHARRLLGTERVPFRTAPL